MFSADTYCLIYGKQQVVAQRMLDFDYLCGRTPSIVWFISPGNKGNIKLSYGASEFLCPVFPDFAHAQPTGAHCLLNFSSHRSATTSTREAMTYDWITTIVVVAEGIPERESRELIALKQQIKRDEGRDILLIGPSTVGWLGAGVLRLWYTGWSLDNIIKSKLYRPWSVGLVSKSWGMMNELCRVIAQNTDWVHTAIALGWDRYPFSQFADIVLAYQDNPDIQMIVMLGEVGNKDELAVADLVKAWSITKPVVAWVSGSFAEQTTQDVQFGHAWAKANTDEEKSSYKIDYLQQAGIHVPNSYREFGSLISSVFQQHCHIAEPLISETTVLERLSVINRRRPSRFSSSISDERGETLLYDGIAVDDFVTSQSIARVIGHLWLKKELPDWALRFITTVLILLADHGPAVSGAINTIVTARAGKDLISSLIAGLATIWPRFGGAIDGAATGFFSAVHNWRSPEQYVDDHKGRGELIQWIGHRVKSKYNPDTRCSLLLEIAAHFPTSTHIDFAKAVEKLTLEKKPNLILNVDGHIAALLLDLMIGIGMDATDIQHYLNAGIANAFFVLARSIGFIGHYLDQQRLDEGLFRTPWDDILYISW